MRKTFAEWVARVLSFTDGALALGAKPTSGQVLRYDGTSITGATMGGGGTPTPTAVGDMIGTTDGAAWVKRTVAQVRSDLNLSLPVVSASAPTVTDDSGDGYAVGQLWIVTTTKLAYILTDATAGAAVWRAVLGQQRLRMYVTSGTVYSILEGYNAGSWVTLKGPAVVSKTAGTSALGTSASGTGFTLPAGYGTTASTPLAGDRWIEALDGTGGLGVTWTPTSDSWWRATIDHSQPTGATGYYSVNGYVGHPTPGSGPGWRAGYGQAAAALNSAAQGNNASTPTAANITRAGPLRFGLHWIGSSTAFVGYADGASSSGFVACDGAATSPTGTIGTMGFGFILLRGTLGGSSVTPTGAELIVYPAPGELSW